MGFWDNLAKLGSYLSGREDALDDRVRRVRKPTNRDEYNAGYDDALRLREIKALEDLARKKGLSDE